MPIKGSGPALCRIRHNAPARARQRQLQAMKLFGAGAGSDACLVRPDIVGKGVALFNRTKCCSSSR
jgi:hypothetical protein